MPLSKDEEFKLVQNACNKQQSDTVRISAEEKLWEYIYGTYFDYLLNLVKRHEKLPDSPDDVCQGFILHLMEDKKKSHENKLCGWRGESSLKTFLTLKLRGYIIDELKCFTEVRFKKDSNCKKEKDDKGNYMIERIIYKKPLLVDADGLVIESENDSQENPDIYKQINPLERENQYIDEMTLKKIKQCQREALLMLAEINPRDVKIITMESNNVDRNVIAKELDVNVRGINKTIGRAYERYSTLFARVLRKNGFDNSSPENLKTALIDVTRDK